MKERLAAAFPFAIAVILPMAGLVFGLWRVVEGERRDGAVLVLLSVAAGLIWAALLTGG